MFGQNNINGRPVGVGAPTGEVVRAAPRTILHFAEARTLAVQWADADGTVHNEFVHEVGGAWYRAPNGENYAKTLRRCAPWLEKAFTERLKDSKPSTIPADAVDIAAGG